MYQTGEYVVYGNHGVCRIAGVEMCSVERRRVRYYVLEPVDCGASRYLVPVDNEAAVSKLHALMSREELEQMLRPVFLNQGLWIPDENQRKTYYRNIVNTGDRGAMLQLIHMLYRHKHEQTAAGRKFRMGDETMLREAEKMMNSEISFVLGISPDQVGAYIREILNV